MHKVSQTKKLMVMLICGNKDLPCYGQSHHNRPMMPPGRDKHSGRVLDYLKVDMAIIGKNLKGACHEIV